jgi:hypothetical protein
LVQTVQVPQPPPTRLFSFMNPLAVEIWLFILLAYVLVSLCMWVVARFTPYEWHNSSVCNCQLSNVHHSHTVAINEASVMAAVTRCTNDFSLANSFWFTIGTLMQQGSDLNPKVLQASCRHFRFFLPIERADYYRCEMTKLHSNSCGIITSYLDYNKLLSVLKGGNEGNLYIN